MESDKAFTHIIIGAGSAGCILAARVTENPGFNVLLIEAGPDCSDPEHTNGSHDIRRVPMKGQSEKYDEAIDWNVPVVLPEGGTIDVAQAKLVGGGSSINGGTALRNVVQDCREWVELGNDAWGWKQVEPVYESLEEDEVRGTAGPHPIARTGMDEAGGIQKAFVSGAMQNGLSWANDLNAAGAEGVGASPVCRRGDQRVSTAATFLDPIRKRPNLKLLAQTMVDRIIMPDRRATGVVLADGQRISATTEIIVSAGALFSPAMLQRSGIGPPSLLSPLGIPLVEALPVGEVLFDHCTVPVMARPKPGAYVEHDYSLQMQARWSSTACPGAIDVQLVCFSYLFATPSDQAEERRSLGGTMSGHVAGIGCNVNKPTSFGSLRIQSRDPAVYPRVAPNYLTTTSDRMAAREAVRLAYRTITSEAMQTVVSPPLDLTDEIIGSDARLDGWMLARYASTYHFSSTCRMAARERGGVVDQSGRVYGIEGLRVADASVLPTVPAANTMWTTCMFAERIGRSIRDGKSVEGLRARM